MARFVDDVVFSGRFYLGPVNKPLKLLIGYGVKGWKLTKLIEERCG